MEDLKTKAKAAFDFTKTLKKVHVTSDGEVFILETDAKMHIKDSKLTDKTVTPFTRDEANDEVTLEDEATLIDKINKAITGQQVYELTMGYSDPREAVITAGKERLDEILALETKN